LFTQSSTTLVTLSRTIPSLNLRHREPNIHVTTVRPYPLYKYHHQQQNSPFWATAFLRKFWQIASGFHSLGFCNNFFYRARSSVMHLTPQPGGPGLCIYVPQWQGGPAICTGTWFPFYCLLRLTELQRRNSNLPPHGVINIIRSLTLASSPNYYTFYMSHLSLPLFSYTFYGLCMIYVSIVHLWFHELPKYFYRWQCMVL
jgi:hypothetical protein